MYLYVCVYRRGRVRGSKRERVFTRPTPVVCKEKEEEEEEIQQRTKLNKDPIQFSLIEPNVAKEPGCLVG